MSLTATHELAAIHELATRLAQQLGLEPVAGDISWDKVHRFPRPGALFNFVDALRISSLYRPKLNFTARFLPLLVAAYKSSPNEGYRKIMVPITSIVYVQRFMQSSSGADLYAFHAQKMIDLDVRSCDVTFPCLLSPSYLTGASRCDSEDLAPVRRSLFPGDSLAKAYSGKVYDDDTYPNVVGRYISGEMARSEQAVISPQIQKGLNGMKTIQDIAISLGGHLPWRICAAQGQHYSHRDSLITKRKRTRCARCKIIAYCSLVRWEFYF
ncbi:hypothetical protein B0H16DRAFT_1478312 [Mycena metata]|uniref:Uncharacterized protein n=1 Tax=Mycena metata TaxID=1033252 RepID=A0AAD7H7E8_9AGAR|nr:hypothetical protein B0H16DRAFT_1478312 [Mycena metata]